MIQKTKQVYKEWIPVHRNMPRVERFGVGSKIDDLFLRTLEYLRRSAYTKDRKKVKHLTKAVKTIDSLKFFLQLGWETKLIPHKQYASIGKAVAEIGRMLGGWKKGVQKKTSTD